MRGRASTLSSAEALHPALPVEGATRAPLKQMNIVIDGYNLIGIKGGMWADLEPQRERLLSDLERYRKIKGNPITVVFDGWRSGLPVEREERTRGIKVIFTRTGEKADQVINRIAEEMGNSCVVVSSDREVASHARSQGAATMSSGEFDERLKLAVLMSGHQGEKDEEDNAPPQQKKGNPRRLPKSERRRRQRLKGL
ncbi:MAG TPA: NYN domain-containing protein [Nitrospiria bacterium]|nr:NYN domain-containing protein [Nitrospiria bacterium]